VRPLGLRVVYDLEWRIAKRLRLDHASSIAEHAA
jgi:hypothetical protein